MDLEFSKQIKKIIIKKFFLKYYCLYIKYFYIKNYWQFFLKNRLLELNDYFRLIK